MKKTALSRIALCFAVAYAFSPSVPVFADNEDGSVTVYTTENVPGANCTQDTSFGSSVDSRRYKCTVQKGFGNVTSMLAVMIRYVTYITGLLGVLMIVVSGIQYSLSGGGDDAKKAKGRIIQLASGLALLFLMGLILNSVAPWIYRS